MKGKKGLENIIMKYRAFLKFQLNECLAANETLGFWKELLKINFSASTL